MGLKLDNPPKFEFVQFALHIGLGTDLKQFQRDVKKSIGPVP
jgi:hypothetical protein